ncbi:trimeric intracellular cation channel type 1B.1 isoform X2 [Lingula anatina]|uniref:Trimeric intracellular cation channel type 1B.1 isoform X2 n=1 Tax=Lingula anatina TaxID=7574 RepID=A0A1S3IK28_LINAN|nr:trimeric intracellular cation channel type 1B.1 isoform X2 [Lingula anatina]|eukprot:XP_013398595.1 trimeric intracellular cation channel type 1B.1 isoform X2 [Lingula anatina]
MDPQTFMNIATTVSKLKMWPYFDVCHYILMALAVREDSPQTGSQAFSRKHPLSCWVSTMLMCFGGSILANLMLGEPCIVAFKRHDMVLTATVVWYLINYSPMDICYKTMRLLPLRVVAFLAVEIRRAKQVHDGVAITAKLHPNAYLLMIIIAVSRGSGSYVIKNFERLVRGLWIPTTNELLQPSFTTKACIAAALIFVLERMNYLTAPHAVIHFGIVIFFIYFRLSSLLLGIHDPFLPFENLFCAVFMGGMWDALRRVKEEVKENGTTKDSKQDVVKGKDEKKKD